MKRTKTVGADVDPPVVDHLDVLARRWSLEHGQKVTRSDVVRALLEDGLNRHPLREGEIDELRQRGMPKFAPPSKPTLRLIDGRASIVDLTREEQRASNVVELLAGPDAFDPARPHRRSGLLGGPTQKYGSRRGGSSVEPPPRGATTTEAA